MSYTIKNIALKVEELIEKIKEICLVENIIIESIDKKSSPIAIEISRTNEKNGLLNIWMSSKGLTLGGTGGKNKELSKIVLDCYNYSIQDEKEIKTVISKQFSYKKITPTHYANIIKKLKELENSSEHIYILEKKDSVGHIKEFYILKNNTTKEKVNIQLFTNQTLLIAGHAWILWNEICYIIESEGKVSVSEIIDRMSGSESPNQISNNNINKSIENIKQFLSEKTINFMEQHDLNFIASAQCILDSKIAIPDYTMITGSTLKAIEGILTKLLVHFNIEKKTEIKNPNWKFNNVFIGSTLKADKIKNLDNLDNKKVESLENIYDLIRKYRNPTSHSRVGVIPVLINNIEDCQESHKSYLCTLEENFNVLFS